MIFGIRRWPLVPTLVVLAAVVVMVALGFWQLGRMDEKAALIARYGAALESGEPRPFPPPEGGAASEEDWFHPASFDCIRVIGQQAIAGRSATDRAGFAQIARCETARGPADVKLGWSPDPAFPQWDGGAVRGLIAPGGADGARLQLAEPVAGLEPLARPDPADLPNNHLAYAGQWFFFALTALVIYVLALRRRQRDQA